MVESDDSLYTDPKMVLEMEIYIMAGAAALAANEEVAAVSGMAAL